MGLVVNLNKFSIEQIRQTILKYRTLGKSVGEVSKVQPIISSEAPLSKQIRFSLDDEVNNNNGRRLPEIFNNNVISPELERIRDRILNEDSLDSIGENTEYTTYDNEDSQGALEYEEEIPIDNRASMSPSNSVVQWLNAARRSHAPSVSFGPNSRYPTAPGTPAARPILKKNRTAPATPTYYYPGNPGTPNYMRYPGLSPPGTPVPILQYPGSQAQTAPGTPALPPPGSPGSEASYRTVESIVSAMDTLPGPLPPLQYPADQSTPSKIQAAIMKRKIDDLRAYVKNYKSKIQDYEVIKGLVATLRSYAKRLLEGNINQDQYDALNNEWKVKYPALNNEYMANYGSFMNKRGYTEIIFMEETYNYMKSTELPIMRDQILEEILDAGNHASAIASVYHDYINHNFQNDINYDPFQQTIDSYNNRSVLNDIVPPTAEEEARFDTNTEMVTPTSSPSFQNRIVPHDPFINNNVDTSLFLPEIRGFKRRAFDIIDEIKFDEVAAKKQIMISDEEKSHDRRKRVLTLKDDPIIKVQKIAEAIPSHLDRSQTVEEINTGEISDASKIFNDLRSNIINAAAQYEKTKNRGDYYVLEQFYKSYVNFATEHQFPIVKMRDFLADDLETQIHGVITNQVKLSANVQINEFVTALEAAPLPDVVKDIVFKSLVEQDTDDWIVLSKKFGPNLFFNSILKVASNNRDVEPTVFYDKTFYRLISSLQSRCKNTPHIPDPPEDDPTLDATQAIYQPNVTADLVPAGDDNVKISQEAIEPIVPLVNDELPEWTEEYQEPLPDLPKGEGLSKGKFYGEGIKKITKSKHFGGLVKHLVNKRRSDTVNLYSQLLNADKENFNSAVSNYVKKNHAKVLSGELPVLNYNINYVHKRDYNPDHPNKVLNEEFTAPIITDPVSAQSQCAINRWTVDGKMINPLLPSRVNEFRHKQYSYNRVKITLDYLKERINQDTNNMLAMKGRPVRDQMNALQSFSNTRQLIDNSGYSSYFGRQLNMNDELAKRNGFEGQYPPPNVVEDPHASTIPQDDHISLGDYSARVPFIGDYELDASLLESKLAELVDSEIIEDNYRPLFKIQSDENGDVSEFDLNDFGETDAPPPSPSGLPEPQNDPSFFNDYQPPSSYDTNNFAAQLISGLMAGPILPPPKPPRMEEELDPNNDVVDERIKKTPKRRIQPPVPMEEELDRSKDVQDHRLKKEAVRRSGLRRGRGVLTKFNLLDKHYKKMNKIPHNDIYKYLNKSRMKPIKNKSTGKGLKRIECQHCKQYRDLLYNKQKGHICKSCHRGTGMMSDRTPVEELDFEEVNEENPSTKDHYNQTLRQEYDDNMKNFEFDNSWTSFEKSAPHALSKNFINYARNNYIAHGEWSNSKLDRLVYLLGYITLNEEDVSDIMIANLNALTAKYLSTLKSVAPIKDIDFSMFDSFKNLKQYITIYPGVLQYMEFEK